MKTPKLFTVKPKHWWQWLSPWFWKRKRITEKYLEHLWEIGLKEKTEKAIKDSMLYGTGFFGVDYKDTLKIEYK